MAGTVRQVWAVVFFPVLLCLPVAADDPAAAAPDPFPMYESIRGNVGFWTRVFGEWSLGQVVVHDLDDPSVVYDVVDLPGPPLVQPYTEEQEDFVEDLRESWEDRLTAIEKKVRRGLELTDDEKATALQLTTHAGTASLEGAAKRVRTQRGLRERFKRGVEISYRYDAILREEFRMLGLPEDLAYMPHVESSFQARARSSVGATGIWQFTRGTGKQYLSITSTIDERLDPLAATRGAAAYLREAFDRLQDWPIAMTSYNHGVGGMARAIKRHGRNYERIFNDYRGRTFGFASRNFYAEFLAARDVARRVDEFFPEGITPEPVWDLDEVELTHRTTAASIAEAYGLQLAEIASLNPGWSARALQDDQALPGGVRVWLPRGTVQKVAAGGKRPVLPAAPEPPVGDHVVRRGQTLIGIADHYGMKLEDLRDLNGLAPGDTLIRVGQRLRVTGSDAPPARHIVRRGETLSGIAGRYGMSVAALRRLNGIRNGSSLIHVGEQLKVRGGASGDTHVVRHGETLSRIASSYRVRLIDLLRVNSLTLHSLIHPGQQIQIPN